MNLENLHKTNDPVNDVEKPVVNKNKLKEDNLIFIDGDTVMFKIPGYRKNEIVLKYISAESNYIIVICNNDNFGQLKLTYDIGPDKKILNSELRNGFMYVKLTNVETYVETIVKFN